MLTRPGVAAGRQLPDADKLGAMLQKLRNALHAVPDTIWVNLAFAAIFLGAALALLGFLQPWVSCPEEDTSAGCPAQAREITIMTAGVLLSAAGFVGTAVLFGWHRRLFSRKP